MKKKHRRIFYLVAGLVVLYVAGYIAIRLRSPYYELKWPDGRVGDEGVAFGFPREAWGNPEYSKSKLKRLDAFYSLVFGPCLYCDKRITGDIRWPGSWSAL